MKKVIGYMVTWTTYGTWLQGDERGYVKDGYVCGFNAGLEKDNKQRIKGSILKLSKRHRDIARKAIEEKAKELKQIISSLAVCTNHIHLVLSNIDESIGSVVGQYKASATKALRERGFEGRVWTKGFDKRYCFNEEELRARTEYVRKHGEK